MPKKGANAGTSTRPLGYPSVLSSLRSALVPECLLEDTPYRQMWREREARLVVVAGRTGLLATAVALVLHHFLVDLPLHKEPALRWIAYRFGGGVFFAALALLYWIPAVQRARWVRLPLLLGTITISALEAKAVEWSPTVSYFYAFVLAVVGVLMLRQSVLGSLGSYALCLGVQWVVAWQDGAVRGAEISSATLVGAMLVLLFRGRVGGDIRWFLTEKRELDAQKKLIETQIELDRLKTNFFTNVSHELRTPLTLVIAPLEAALQSPRALTSELRDDLELALRNAQRLLGEINTLLDLSRIDARRERLHLEQLEVVPVLRELVESGRRLAESKHIDLAFEPEEDLPAFPLDQPKLEKVVLNLLSNALRYTDGSGDRHGRVTVRCGRRAGRFFCSVEDTGIGIPGEHLSRIFDRFHQVEVGGRGSRGGTGIGLALVKELVELQNGNVAVWSEPGRGSVFTVELPLDAPSRPVGLSPVEGDSATVRPSAAAGPRAPACATSEPEAARAEDSVGRMLAGPFRPLVLVVDDNSELLDYVARQLAEEFRVRTAADVDGALREVKEGLPDLVVSDLMMPGRSGAELLRALRDEPATRHLPFVLLTARAEAESRVEGLEAGADDYLAKPFSPAELRARIRSLLARGRAERELENRNAFLAKVNLDLVLSKRKVLIETMEAFALAVEAKDPYTHGHSRRVSLLAETVCREMGLGNAAGETVRIAGILHDIGKIGMPEVVLKKPGKLSAAEMETFKRHSQIGSRIVSAVTELEEVGRAILHHHERFDGQGYPEKLAGEQIPLLSRILAVCDSYDAMTSDRPYRTSVPHRLAMEEIGRGMGKQFDPAVAQIFLQLYFASPPAYPEYTSALRERSVVEAIQGAGA